METRIFHTVNAGLYLWNHNTGILIDGIHTGKETGFSLMPPTLTNALDQHAGLFAHTDVLLFTHLHNDHFNRPLLQRALEHTPQPLVYGPLLPESTTTPRQLCPGLCSIELGQARALALETVHDGKLYQDVRHDTFLLQFHGESIFVAGDAILEPDQARILADFHGVPTAAAFINVYHAASASAQAFLRSLAPERVFLYHLPFPEDDAYHYYSTARQITRRWPDGLPPLETLPLMGWVDHTPAPWQ